MIRSPHALATMVLATALSAAFGCGGDDGPPLPEGFRVLTEATGDLDADGREETVRLVGRGAADSPFREDLNLAIGPAPQLWPLPSAARGGYAPSLRLADVTGDGHLEIVITADTGGSGGLVAAAVVAARLEAETWALRTIYDSEAGPFPRFSGDLAPGFTAQLDITAPGLGHRREQLDLSGRRDFYLQAGVYAEDGTLLRDVSIWGDGLMRIAPLTHAAGGPGLQLTQQARGVANVDRLAEIRTLLVWQEDQWQATNLYILPLD